MSQARIFLAHAKEDEAAVMELYDRLKEKGYNPWLDKKDLIPGQNWREVIPEVIENSDIFIACLSNLSISKRGYIQKEFRMALIERARRPPKSIFLIPVRLDACDIPDLRNAEYGVNLKDYHWLDYFESDGFEQLERAIKHQFGQLVEDIPQVPKVPIPAAPKVPKPQPATFVEKSFIEQLPHGISLDMVYIEEGIFLMGSPENEEGRYDDEGPQHRVAVSAFHMGKYPVTQNQLFFISKLPQIERELKHEPSRFKGDNLPVESVSWYDAVEFCKRLSVYTRKDYKLPSEAEWEYACRAETKTAYSFGNSITKDQVNCEHKGLFGRDVSVGKTTPVGKYPANKFGLHDMHGNLYEWCQDYWHSNYEGAPTDGSAWIEGGKSFYRILRGGHWYSYPRFCRSACRRISNPDGRNGNIGFRVVCRAPRALL